MQLIGGFIQEAVSSGSAAVAQSMCNAVLDIAVLFTSPSPKLHEQLQQVLSQLALLQRVAFHYLLANHACAAAVVELCRLTLRG